MDYTWFFVIFLIVVALAYFAMGSSTPKTYTGLGEFDIVDVVNGADGAGESWDDAA